MTLTLEDWSLFGLARMSTRPLLPSTLPSTSRGHDAGKMQVTIPAMQAKTGAASRMPILRLRPASGNMAAESTKVS